MISELRVEINITAGWEVYAWIHREGARPPKDGKSKVAHLLCVFGGVLWELCASVCAHA